MFLFFGSSDFQPTQLEGNTLWLDASDTSTITDSSGSVSAWADKSGNGNNGTASTTARPATGDATLSGKNGLRFDGVANTLTLPSALYSIPNGNNTMFVVSRTTLDTTSGRIVGMSEGGSGRYWIEDNSTSGRVGFANRNVSSGTISVDGVDKLNSNIYTCRRSGTTQGLSINGSTESSNTNALSEDGIDAAFIGSNAGVNTFFTGDIFEVIIYNRALSDSEVALVNAYLSNKWGILIEGDLSLSGLYGSTLPFTVNYTGITFSTDVTMTDYKITPTTTYYVATTGSSGNTGLTVGSPKATVDQAIALGNASGSPYEIQVAAGTYDRNKRWSTSPTQDCNIIGSGTCILSAEQALTYTADGGAYTATRSAVEWVYDTDFTDANGTYQRLDLAASVAACQATAGTWFTDGADVWVHTSDSRDLSADNSGIKVFLGVQGGQMQSNNTLYIENIDFEGFYRFCVRMQNTSSAGGAKFYMNGGSAKYAQEGEVGNGNNIRLDGVDEAILKDVVTADAYLDGFNYHDLNGVITTAYEIDCESYDCGYSGSASNNASTIHDGSKIIRVNGVYQGAEGRNIHDIDDGSISINLGSNSNNSRGSGTSNDINFTNGDGDGGLSKMYLINCKSSGSEVDVRSNDGAITYINASSSLVDGDNIEDGTGIINTINL